MLFEPSQDKSGIRRGLRQIIDMHELPLFLPDEVFEIFDLAGGGDKDFAFALLQTLCRSLTERSSHPELKLYVVTADDLQHAFGREIPLNDGTEQSREWKDTCLKRNRDLRVFGQLKEQARR